MNIWEQRYNEQTALCAAVIKDRDALGELLEQADKMLSDFGVGSQGSPLRVNIDVALKNYRIAKRVRETHYAGRCFARGNRPFSLQGDLCGDETCDQCGQSIWATGFDHNHRADS